MNKNKLPDLNKRVLDVINHFSDGNVAEFSRTLDGVSQQRLDRLFKLDKRNGKYPTVSVDITKEILDKYPVSSDWLLKGEGNMLKENVGETSLEIVYDNPKGVPYFENIEATGSILSLYNDYPEVPTFYINYPHFDDCTAYVPMVGDSMFPMYSSGEIIAVKKVDNTDIHL